MNGRLSSCSRDRSRAPQATGRADLTPGPPWHPWLPGGQERAPAVAAASGASERRGHAGSPGRGGPGKGKPQGRSCAAPRPPPAPPPAPPAAAARESENEPPALTRAAPLLRGPQHPGARSLQRPPAGQRRVDAGPRGSARGVHCSAAGAGSRRVSHIVQRDAKRGSGVRACGPGPPATRRRGAALSSNRSRPRTPTPPSRTRRLPGPPPRRAGAPAPWCCREMSVISFPRRSLVRQEPPIVMISFAPVP